MTRLAIAALFGVAWTATGCGTNKELLRKDEEIARLKRMNALTERTLEEKLGMLERLQARARELEGEKHAALARVRNLESELERERTGKASLESKVAELDKELEDARVAYQRLSKEHARVKDVASATANELAELRLKRQELLERTGVLSRENVGLRQENLRLSRELDQLRSELVKERAALRAQSLQKGAVAREVEERLKALEEENRTLREEKAGLLARLEGLQAASMGQQGAVTSGSDSGVRREPKAVFGEAASLAARRVRSMVRGEAQWDGTDVVLAAAAVAGLLVLLWLVTAPIRLRRRRRMRAQLNALRRRVNELEDGIPEPSSRGRVRRSPPRPGVVRRSRQFSPILAAPEGEDTEPEPEQSWDEAEQTLDAAHGAEGEEAAPVDEFSGHEADAGEEEDFADQMVTVSLGGPLDVEESEEPVAESPRKPQPAEAEGGDEFEDDFAHTQVIGGFDLFDDESADAKSPGKEKKKGKRRPGGGDQEQELLSELKHMIGEKFDEYMK